MIKHKSPISGIATFDNKYIATTGYDNIVILWDSKKNESIARGCHDHLVNQCVFSTDGSFLATSSSDYSARIWKVPEMKLVSIINHHTDDVEGLSFHSEKPILATSSRDKTICISDLNGNLIKKLEGHDADVISVEWIKGTDILISSSDDGTVRYWDTITGEVLRILSFSDVETDTIAITKGGAIFAGNDNGEIIIIKEGNIISKTLAHKAGIKRLIYSDVIKKVISLSYDRTFKIWNYNDDVLDLDSIHSYEVIVWARSCAFLNNNEIVFGTFGDKYALFNLREKKWDLNDVKNTGGINSVLIYKNDTYAIGDSGILYINGNSSTQIGSLCNFLIEFKGNIITGGQTGEVFDAISGEILYQHKSPLNCAAKFVNLGVEKLIIGAYTGEGIILFNNEGRISLERVLRLHSNAIKGISASVEIIFSVCATGAAAFNSTSDFGCIKYIDKAHSKIANGCTGIKGNYFASISRDLKLRIVNEKNIEEISTLHKNSIKCIASNKIGSLLALGDYNGNCSVYDTQSKKFIKYSKISDFGISSITFDNEKNSFFASSYNGRIIEVNVN
jgi:WD40 repeat protein